MKIEQVVYYCLEAIKALSDDSFVNEEHILFLLGKYRGLLLQQYHNIKKFIPESNYQTICLDLEPTQMLPCTNGPRLRSLQKVPALIPIGKPSVLLVNGLESEVIEFVNYSRLKAVGYNKWKKNFIYCAIGPDSRLYMAFTNPQAQYLERIKLRGIFEDLDVAVDLNCGEEGEPCELMEKEFPLEVALIPELIARVVKDGLGIIYKPADMENNSQDDLANLIAFVRKNMKNPIQQQIEE